MMSLWWLALPVLLLPIWWHRQKRERVNATPLATARFLPRTDPQQQRVWRWADRVLLLVRCLLLATLIAWLADMVLPWRGDSVLVVPGTDNAWAVQQAKEAGFTGADMVPLAGPDAFGWLAKHEREFQADARLLVVGAATMPAQRPAMAHQVTVRSKPAQPVNTEHRIAIVSKRASQWRALFAALDGSQRYVVTAQPGPKSELIVWDVPEAPPAGLRAPLWWIGDATAFPELKNAAVVDGLRHADSARGRLWSHAAWPAADAGAARRQFETWQRLHYPALAYTAPPQLLAAAPAAAQAPLNGALRNIMSLALIALLALERILAHARRH